MLTNSFKIAAVISLSFSAFAGKPTNKVSQNHEPQQKEGNSLPQGERP